MSERGAGQADVKTHEATLHFSCDAGWEDMEGDERERHCYTCSKNVVNLSNMTELEAQRFIDEHREQHMCVRAELDQEGFVVFASPQPPTRPVRSPRNTLAATALTLPMLLVGCSESQPLEPPNMINLHPDAPVIDHYHPKHQASILTIRDVPPKRQTLLLKILTKIHRPHEARKGRLGRWFDENRERVERSQRRQVMGDMKFQ